jgi:para-nitrobenzyl esterase
MDAKKLAPIGRLGSALCSALLATIASWGTPAIASPTLIIAPDGTFQGKVDTSGAVREFLGIRYAEPVTGNRRWKSPQPITPPFGVQNATTFGHHCPQTASPFGNGDPGDGSAGTAEDCLFLNVYAPNHKGPLGFIFDELEPHAVMVWIHGGALVVGESDEYDATKLVEKGVVVVTINYRLGALGFLAHSALSGESPDHISGNYGIEDQQEALRWVHKNIRAFGGDPNRVTIFGESAGGLSTFVNLVSPTAKGLFDRAIVESGAYQQTQPTLAQSQTLGSNFATAVGCTQSTSSAALACLRALPVSTILANQSATFTGTGPAPTVDGKVLTQSIGPALGSGQFNRVPVVNGSNHDEWRLFVSLDFDLVGHPIPNTEAGYEAAIATLTGPVAAPIVAAQYPLASFPSADLAFGALGTDAVFACPALGADTLTSAFVPTYAYEFNDENAPQNFLPPVTFPYGASHASEIQYLFPTANPTTFGLKLPQVALNAGQQQLSASMVLYWTKFAKDGNPNSAGNPNWPVFNGTNPVMVSLVPATPTTESNFSVAHHCAFWAALTAPTD